MLRKFINWVDWHMVVFGAFLIVFGLWLGLAVSKLITLVRKTPPKSCPEYRVPAFKVVGTEVWHMNAVPVDSVIYGTWKQVEGSTIIKQ